VGHIGELYIIVGRIVMVLEVVMSRVRVCCVVMVLEVIVRSIAMLFVRMLVHDLTIGVRRNIVVGNVAMSHIIMVVVIHKGDIGEGHIVMIVVIHMGNIGEGRVPVGHILVGHILVSNIRVGVGVVVEVVVRHIRVSTPIRVGSVRMGDIIFMRDVLMVIEILMNRIRVWATVHEGHIIMRSGVLMPRVRVRSPLVSRSDPTKATIATPCGFGPK
jgi:hypothetical protein